MVALGRVSPMLFAAIIRPLMGLSWSEQDLYIFALILNYLAIFSFLDGGLGNYVVYLIKERGTKDVEDLIPIYRLVGLLLSVIIVILITKKAEYINVILMGAIFMSVWFTWPVSVLRAVLSAKEKFISIAFGSSITNVLLGIIYFYFRPNLAIYLLLWSYLNYFVWIKLVRFVGVRVKYIPEVIPNIDWQKVASYSAVTLLHSAFFILEKIIINETYAQNLVNEYFLIVPYLSLFYVLVYPLTTVLFPKLFKERVNMNRLVLVVLAFQLTMGICLSYDNYALIKILTHSDYLNYPDAFLLKYMLGFSFYSVGNMYCTDLLAKGKESVVVKILLVVLGIFCCTLFFDLASAIASSFTVYFFLAVIISNYALYCPAKK